jgi:UDP-N-acetylglucosamine diphosphorylase/glucosamine-1-phosphate N-acetyltransferase
MTHKNIILFDDDVWESLLPLSYTKPVSELRVGITTISEKWKHFVGNVSWHTQSYLSAKYPLVLKEDNIFISASVIPTQNFVNVLKKLEFGQSVVKNERVIAFRDASFDIERERVQVIYKEKMLTIDSTWDIFEKNDAVMRLDFETITKGRKSEPISKTNNIIGSENIFVEKGAKLEYVTIDASEGVVYIGKDASIMIGALIQGSLALCEHATIKMGAKIYGATTVGPWCKVGGEVQNAVFSSYSNKGHDGYLGNSVIGDWCNIGADTNNSNLKNNYAIVKLWDYASGRFKSTGLQFCGLIMGDHSKCGINTMFNTGTVVGVSANIFGSGFPRNFIPSFSWGGAAGFSLYTVKKAFETAEVVMARRNLELDLVDKDILEQVFILTEKYRK